MSVRAARRRAFSIIELMVVLGVIRHADAGYEDACRCADRSRLSIRRDA